MGRSLRGRNGSPFQYSCLENPIDIEAWWATVHRVAKSQTQLSDLAYTHVYVCVHIYIEREREKERETKIIKIIGIYRYLINIISESMLK